MGAAGFKPAFNESYKRKPLQYPVMCYGPFSVIFRIKYLHIPPILAGSPDVPRNGPFTFQITPYQCQIASLDRMLKKLFCQESHGYLLPGYQQKPQVVRSEERRVGKECVSTF